MSQRPQHLDSSIRRSDRWVSTAASFGGWLAIMTPAVITIAVSFDNASKSSLVGYSLVIALGWLSLIGSVFVAPKILKTVARVHQERLLLAVCLGSIPVTAYVMSASESVLALAALWTTMQLPAAILVVAANELAGRVAFHDVRSNASGFVGASALSAVIVGSALTSLVQDSLSLMFVVPALTASAMCVPLARRYYTYQTSAMKGSIAVTPAQKKFLIAAGLVSTATSATNTYVVPYVDLLNVSDSEATSLAISTVLMASVVSLGSTVLGGWVAPSLSRARQIYRVGALLVALALFALVAQQTPGIFIVSALLFGLGFGLANGNEITFVISTGRGMDYLAKDVALLVTVTSGPYVIVPLVGGALTGILGSIGVLYLYAMCAILCIIAMRVISNATTE